MRIILSKVTKGFYEFLKGTGMKDPKKNRDKVVKNQIKRKNKPFSDTDFQFQSADLLSGDNQENFSCHPVYAHFASNQVKDFLFSQINEAEIVRSMKEAEESFKAWNKMKKQLEQIKNSEENQISPPFLA